MGKCLSLACCVPAVLLILVSCAPIEKRIVGRWGDADHVWVFHEDGTFLVERGILAGRGRFHPAGKDQVRLEFEGFGGLLQRLNETINGPRDLVLKVTLQGDTLQLRLPDGKNLQLKKL